MRIPSSERGAAMIAALCMAMVFAISLSSYIALCYVSLNMSTRSIMLSHCAELAETGVEQALYSVNNNDWSLWTTSGGVATTTMTMTPSGLALSSTSPTPLNYGNGMNGTVNITVTNYNTSTPSISSQAQFTLPVNGYGNQVTTSSTVSYGPPTLPSTAAVPLFVNAVAATTGTVRFRAGGTLDSFDSIIPAGGYQTYATYNAVKPGYSAIVVSQDNATFGASVRLGNAVVHGYASGYNTFFPSTTNWLSYGGAGQLVGPNTPTGTTIDSSRLLTSPVPYQPLFLENLPSNFTSLPMGGGTVSSDGATINQTGTLGSTTATAPVVYSVGNGISLTSNQIVTIQGPVVLICYGNVNIAGTAQIILTTPQASLQIFLEYGSLTLGGNGIVNANAIPLPKKVCILSTTNLWFTATISQNQPFYGVIYFPNLPITVSTAQPIYGSIVGYSVTCTSAITLHYDLALRSPMPPYTSAIPLQSGAAFDNLSAPVAFSNMLATVP